MAALDFPNSPTLNQQYAAPNGVTYQWDGAAWIVTGGPPGQLWTGSGSTLTPTDATKTVAVPAGAVSVGNRTIKGRLLNAATLDAAYLTSNAYLATGDVWTQDDTSKASWLVRVNAGQDVFNVIRTAAGGTTPATVLQLDPTGLVTVPGDPAAMPTLLLGPQTAKGRVQAQASTVAPGGIGFFGNRNWLTNAQDDATKPSWGALLNFGTDSFQVQRSPAGSTTQTNVLAVDNAGNLTISGPTGTKSTGTTWANPSDRRIKKNIAPYTQGLAAVLALKPSTFEFNGKAGSQDGLRGIGLIADDVQPVMPEMVSVTPTKLDPDDAAPVDLLTLDTSALVLALVNALQELAATVAALTAAAAPPTP